MAPMGTQPKAVKDQGAAQHRQPVRSTRRRVGFFLTVMILGIALFFVGGFFRFAGTVSSVTAPADARAEAIVVLTGGSARIAAAVNLLAEDRAERLLISGVHPQTTSEQIARLNKKHETLFSCCVDLDRKALDTVGNAAETAVWARERAYRSLIVVTSAYHMPRSLAELAGQLPDVQLIAYPVVVDELRLRNWYRHMPALRLLVAEYMKYIVARLRLAFD